MKKLFAMLLAVAMLLCFAACEVPETPDTSSSTTGSNTGNTGNEPVQDSFSFLYKGTTIALHAPAAPIIAALGTPDDYTESTSCAFDGLDKTYRYGSVYLMTYPLGDKDYVYGWWFTDDLVSNDEDISINSPMNDVEAMYGLENFDGVNQFIIKKGSGTLTIIMKNDKVDSIQYFITD